MSREITAWLLAEVSAARYYTKDTVLQETFVRYYTKDAFLRHYTEETVAGMRVMPL